MMNQFKKGIEDIRAIQLSAEEKQILRTHIFSRPVPSPYKINILFSISRSWVSYSIATLLVIVLIGGSAALAAEGSVPGDLLYPIKVAVTEPARDLLTQAPADRARWESEKASRRLEEATTLVTRNELTPERSQEIGKRLHEHANATAEALGALGTEDASSTAHAIEKEFDDTLAQHAQELHIKQNTATSTPETSSLEDTITEIRKQFREDTSGSRGEHNRQKSEGNSNISNHNGSPRQERDRLKQTQQEEKGSGSRPDTSE